MTALLRLAAAASVCAILSVGRAADAATPFNSQAIRTELNAALDRSDLPAAWQAARTWTDSAPNDPSAHLAAAQLSLQFNAPAAAISAAGAGLAALTDATRHLERPLLALKAQAHTAVGEHAPAWAAFSRIVAQAKATELNDPVVATARRARWDSFTQLSTHDSYERFMNRLLAATSASDAAPAARVRLAYWLATNKDPGPALDSLRAPLIAQPQSPELRAAFADLFLAAINSAQSAEEINEVYKQNADELGLLRQGSDPDPLGTAVIWILQKFRTPEPEMERQAPRDIAPVVKTLTATMAERRTRLLAQINTAASAARDGHDQFAAWFSTRPTVAEILAWEKTQLATITALRNSLGELTRLEDTANFLHYTLVERTEGPSASAEDRAALAELKKYVPTSEEQKTAMREADDTFAAIPWSVVNLRVKRRALAAQEQLATAKTPAEQFALTDDALAAGDLTAQVWRVRSAAALALGDRAEALASGARAFVAEWVVEKEPLDRELAPATMALLANLEREVGGAAAFVASANAAWESGNAEKAFAHLDSALALDPALPAVWRLRGQWCEAGGDLAGAAFALDRWWRLDDCTPYDRSLAFGIASRAGAWELLLSLADARLAVDPTDTEALLFRAHAAFACNRPSVARAALPVLDVSVQRDPAMLLTVALGCLDPKSQSGVHFGMTSLRGTPQEPLGLTELIGCYERLRRAQATVPDPKPADLAAKPAAIHLERLEGRMAPADYLARTRGTPQEPMAAFISFFLATLEGASTESREMAAALSADHRLPLVFRALAHRALVADRTVQPQPALRASDLYYASSARDAAPWGAPGQEVFIEQRVEAIRLPAEYPVRLRGPDDTSVAVALPTGTAGLESPHRLWELRSLTVQGSFYRGATKHRPVLAANGSRFTAGELNLAGAARFDRCDFDRSTLILAAGASADLREPNGEFSDAQIAGSLRVTGGMLTFSRLPKVAATGRIDISRTQLHGALPFALPAGAQSSWRDVILYSTLEWPSDLPAGWNIQGALITAPNKGAAQALIPLAAPHTGRVHVLATRHSTPTYRANTIAELLTLLAKAKPGDTVQLATGEHKISAPIEVPPGVTLAASNGTKLWVERSSPGAFKISKAGAVRITGFRTEVVSVTSTYHGFPAVVTDGFPKTAVIVGSDAWAMVEYGSFTQWNHPAHKIGSVAAGGRLEFFQHHVDDQFTIDPKGVLVRGTPRYDASAALRTIVSERTRTELWRDAGARFDRAVASSKTREERQQAGRALAKMFGETALRTGASKSDSVRALMKLVVPTLQRFPAEAPYIFGSTAHFHLDHPETVRAMMPAHLLPYFKTFTASYYEAQSLGAKVSSDNVYSIMLAHPPGSPTYAAAREAMARNLTNAQFEAEFAAKKQREAELAVALEKQRKESARLAAEAAKRAPQYASAPSSSGSSSSSSSNWSSRSYSAPSYTPPPAWTPSESYKMQVYRHNLNVQISNVTRRY